MQVICDGRFIEIEEPATFRCGDKLAMEVNCVEPDQVLVHLFKSRHYHVGTIELSQMDARHLARQLKKAARIAAEPE